MSRPWCSNVPTRCYGKVSSSSVEEEEEEEETQRDWRTRCFPGVSFCARARTNTTDEE